MTTVIVLVVAALAGLGSFVLLRRRSGRASDGVAQFQRHIGALSPEARREVIDRVRASQHPGPAHDSTQDSAD